MMLLKTAVCSLLFAPAAFSQASLDCSDLQERRTPFSETARFAQAPRGASRPTPHRLVIGWAGGVREFVDVAPYGVDTQEGVRHTYCGYDARVAMHLVYRYTEDGVDGVLINDSAGVEQPAGYRVLFTADHRRYLAIVQPEGWGGQEWRVYSRNGRLLIKGPSSHCDKDFNCGGVDNPRWNARGDIEADATCGRWGDSTSYRAQVRIPISGSRWTWTPRTPCPPP